MRLERKTYETKAEKRRDIWIGFGGWFGLNVPLAVLAPFTGAVGILVIGILALLLNVGGLILLAFTRRWMAAGALVALVAVMVLAPVSDRCSSRTGVGRSRGEA